MINRTLITTWDHLTMLIYQNRNLKVLKNPPDAEPDNENEESSAPKAKEGIVLWTEQEKQKLIEIAQQLSTESKFSYLDLAENFLKFYPHKGYVSVHEFAENLINKGELIIPCKKKPQSEIERAQNSELHYDKITRCFWTDEEEEILLELSRRMMSDKHCHYINVARIFIDKFPSHPLQSVSAHIRLFAKEGKIAGKPVRRKKKWTKKKNSN